MEKKIFEMKPHFEWVKFRLSYRELQIFSPWATQTVIDYLMWKGAL